MEGDFQIPLRFFFLPSVRSVTFFITYIEVITQTTNTTNTTTSSQNMTLVLQLYDLHIGLHIFFLHRAILFNDFLSVN